VSKVGMRFGSFEEEGNNGGIMASMASLPANFLSYDVPN
jgi:hypothetical protein